MSRFARHLTLRPLLALALCAAAACASRAAEETSSSSRTPRRQGDLITADEIARANASNTYHAIELLRPTFLRTRGPTSINNSLQVAVYVNGQRWGDVGTLRGLPANDVMTIRRLSAAEAQSRYGLDNTAGALEVTTKGAARP